MRTSDVTRFTISPRPGFFHASYFLLVGPYKCGVRTSDLIRLALNPLPGRLVVRFFFNVVISFDIRGMRTSDLLRFTFFPLPEGMHPEELGTYVLFEINVILRSLPWASYTATHCNTLQHTATHCNTLQHRMLLSYVLSEINVILKSLSLVSFHVCLSFIYVSLVTHLRALKCVQRALKCAIHICVSGDTFEGTFEGPQPRMSQNGEI